jgi:hypothetical protein
MSVAVTSIEAFRTTTITPLREKVLEVIESYGADGCITDDVIEAFRKVVRVGDTRVGVSGKRQLIMRHAKYTSTMPTIFPKKSPNPFVKGVMFAAKAILDADPTFKGTPGALKLLAELKKLHRR